ncbi:MAG: hypothetical protein ACM3X9_15310 [Bacillota bacterium]
MGRNAFGKRESLRPLRKREAGLILDGCPATIPASDRSLNLLLVVGDFSPEFNPRAAFQEFCRVLKSGGKLCLVVPVTPNRNAVEEMPGLNRDQELTLDSLIYYGMEQGLLFLPAGLKTTRAVPGDFKTSRGKRREKLWFFKD